MNDAAVNLRVQVSVWTCFHVSRARAWEWGAGQRPALHELSGSRQNVFPRGCTTITVPAACEGSISPLTSFYFIVQLSSFDIATHWSVR